jgi:hypothetical protein
MTVRAGGGSLVAQLASKFVRISSRSRKFRARVGCISDNLLCLQRRVDDGSAFIS